MGVFRPFGMYCILFFLFFCDETLYAAALMTRGLKAHYAGILFLSNSDP